MKEVWKNERDERRANTKKGRERNNAVKERKNERKKEEIKKDNTKTTE